MAMRLIWKRLLQAPRAHITGQNGDVTTLRVDGVVCDKVCAVRTKQALASLPGVRSVTVDYERGTATVEGGSPDEEEMNRALGGVVAGMGARRVLERAARRLHLTHGRARGEIDVEAPR